MKIPVSYSFRNLWTRRLTTAFTASGMALVVFVFASILMLSEGLKKTLVTTGSYNNVVVIRKGAGSEVQSGIDRDPASIVEIQPEIAVGPDGQRLIAKELVVLINLQKRGSTKPGQVVIRGVTGNSLILRPQVKLVKGRLPRSGSSELMAGLSIAKRFQGAGLAKHCVSACATGTLSAFLTQAIPASPQRYGGMLTSSCSPSAGLSTHPSSFN